MSKTCPHCGCSHDANEKPRSLPQLRRYFALIRAAYHHWPDYAHKVIDEEDLRKWLQMSAGWRRIGARVPLKGIDPQVAKMLVAQVFAQLKAHEHTVIFDNELIVWCPESIAFAKMGPAEFNELIDNVSDVIEVQTGLRVEDLMKETA